MAKHPPQPSGTDRPLRQIILLLFTAAVSFTFGVVIGRSNGPTQPIIKVTMATSGEEGGAGQSYNFYKALPKGETTALGSGINQKSPSSVAAAAPPPVGHQEETPPPLPAKERSVTEPPALPRSEQQERSGGWILQASSNPREEDAQKLGKRLRSKGFRTEVKAVQIKGKTWFRLYVGPYATANAAKEAAAKLTRQEGVAPIARRL